ncbi:hypothetical protein [Histidinibacterium aquaticum]|uniref:Uncharacterized protein n=1 Tax=Histidinibacterium aquaticum TaxID=2613962 RepID=A0A5J5GQY2_9RHOB|nr:hypothetical protein [Histidinibacterium aquaticum]KAA9010163.1 hypothetical protein F3S47_02620 [Histidinibacterium aquaticum]
MTDQQREKVTATDGEGREYEVYLEGDGDKPNARLASGLTVEAISRDVFAMPATGTLLRRVDDT